MDLYLKRKNQTSTGIQVSEVPVQNLGVTDEGIAYIISSVNGKKWKLDTDANGIIDTGEEIL